MKQFVFMLLIWGITSSYFTLLICQERDTMSVKDSLSNYQLFEYVETLTSEDYFSFLDDIKSGRSDDYFSLRMAYTKTKAYSPYDFNISDSLKKAESFIESKDYSASLLILENIQEEHFVNIISHLYCGYIYAQLGDSLKSKFHYDVYAGLLNSIYESGNGDSPRTAYIVISTKEEYNFLNWFDLKFMGQSLIHEDGYSFDLMKAANDDTGEEYNIYFNVSLGFRALGSMFGSPESKPSPED